MAIGQFPVSGKVVAVTGAGSGINLAFAQLASAQGAKVLIGDLRLTPEAEEFVETSPNVHFVQCDVAIWKDLQNLITVSEEIFGDVPDVYIAGAGIFEPAFSNYWLDTEEESYATMNVNAQHPIKLTRIATRALLSKNKKGVVLIISSIAGFGGVYACPLYCATKHAIVGFVSSMKSAEDREGVKVVCICPGFVTTSIWGTFPHLAALVTGESNSGAVPGLPPLTIAEAMLELVQDEKYPGGTVMKVDESQKTCVPIARDIYTKSGDRSGSIEAILDKERNSALAHGMA